MLPEALSTGATSLLEGADKLGVVIEFVVSGDGSVHSGIVYRAVVRNKAQLTYDAVGAWLEKTAPAPAKVAASTDLQQQLTLQDGCAQRLMNARYRHGALNIDTIETRPVLRARRRRRRRPAAEESRDRADRRLHDRGQRSGGADARGSSRRFAAS